MPKYFQILKEVCIDICGYASVSPKKRKNCMRSFSLGGKKHRKGSVTNAKVGGKWREKKRSRRREKVILKSFRFEAGQGNCLGRALIV